MVVGKDVTISKAIELLERKYGPLLNRRIASDVFEIFGASSRFSIKPYHVENATLSIYEYIVRNELEVFAEKKYDGAHMQISSGGIFKHDGSLASADQLAYFIFYCCNNEDMFEKFREAVGRGYTIEFELFGRDYTPMGFHKAHNKQVDVVVFEVGRDAKWIPPPEKYYLLDELKLPYADFYKVNYVDLGDLVSRVVELATMPDTYEGVVVKSKFVYEPELPDEYVKTSTLVVFKVKKEVLIEREKFGTRKGTLRGEEIKIDVDTLAILKSEIRNEIGKIRTEQGEVYLEQKENFPYVISRIEKYLRDEHTRLYNNIVEFASERDLRKVIAGELLLAIKMK